ncbi:MAG: TetR/AcrR family transcriptional regulator [Pseudomonadota bacterium]|nr:TetR/AcrR family transcriptional regulator [Pseudomonadota bacterium]
MPVSPEKKRQTHQRIVSTAAREFRQHGLNGIGVADLMRAAGLTHGGFYAHFASKDELIAEAITAARSEAGERLHQSLEEHRDPTALQRFIKSYLSPLHVRSPAQGCLFASLGGELGRQSEQGRAAATLRVEDHVEMLSAAIAAADEDESAGESRQQAMGLLAALVGAVVLARAVDNEALSGEILRSTRQFIANGLAADTPGK